jgi:hypothetical protein
MKERMTVPDAEKIMFEASKKLVSQFAKEHSFDNTEKNVPWFTGFKAFVPGFNIYSTDDVDVDLDEMTFLGQWIVWSGTPNGPSAYCNVNPIVGGEFLSGSTFNVGNAGGAFTKDTPQAELESAVETCYYLVLKVARKMGILDEARLAEKA